jgi:aquaporin NIP
MKEIIKKSLAEFVATFFMVLCGTGSIVINQEYNGAISHLGIAISFGLAVSIMIYTFGKISGAHMNPAVSFALVIGGHFPLKHFTPYLISQTLGAIAASLTLHLLFPNNQLLGGTFPAGSSWQSFIFEFLLSLLLMLVILSFLKTSESTKSIAGVVIGLVILLEALFAGPVCGASMNPVRSLAPGIVSGNLNAIWIYLTAPFAGTLIAVVLNRYLSSDVKSN